ncbi:MAG: hypothetical protein R6T99_02915 [Bacteroidales bacterium]
MKKILIALILSISLTGYSQKHLQIKDQKIEITGVWNGEPAKAQTGNFRVMLNYETGRLDIVLDLSNLDLIPEQEKSGAAPKENIVRITGNLPLEIIQYSEDTDQSYTVELHFLHEENTVTRLFDLAVKNYSNQRSGLHRFIASTQMDPGKFFNNNMDSAGEKITIIVSFQAYIIG